MQLAHGNQGRFAHAQAGLDQIAQFQEAHAQPVAARFGAIDKAANGQIVEDAVRGRGVQAGALADLLERYRFLARGQHVDQREHAFQDLDAGLGGGRVIVFFHEAEWGFGIRSF